MEPTVIVGGALLLLMMLGGKKKGGKVGPLEPGEKPTPLPGGHDKGPSDPLPGGSKGGHLPKSKGYSPPSDMTTTDLWISPDCQAWVAGEDYHPYVGNQDAYDWYRDIGGFRDYSPRGAEAADLWYGTSGDWEPFHGEIFPDHQATADIFALQVIIEASPMCAETIPRFDQYEYLDDFQMAFHLWLTQYPALGELLILLVEDATYGGELRELTDKEGLSYMEGANMAQADGDWFYENGLVFDPAQCPAGTHPVYVPEAEAYTCEPD